MQEITIAAGALLQLVCTGILVAAGIGTCGVVVWYALERAKRWR